MFYDMRYIKYEDASMNLKLSHYAIAVHDLSKAAETYNKLFGMKVSGEIHNEWGSFDALELGFFGERTLLLMSPTDEKNNISQQMKLRSTESNPYGDGFHVAVFQSDDPRDAAAYVEKQGGKVIDSGLDSGMHIVHPMSCNFVLWEIQPTRPSHNPDIDLKFSHIGIAVNDLDASVETYTKIFSLVQEPAKWVSDAGKFKTAPISLNGNQVVTLLNPQSDDAPMKRLMNSRIDKFNLHGEGFYMAIWTSKDPLAWAKKIQSAGGRVLDDGSKSGRVLIHPSSTHGILMEITSESA
jgi:catechol 2,3-dioxygenase-like lactoylglutathione lyase family enzyme